MKALISNKHIETLNIGETLLHRTTWSCINQTLCAGGSIQSQSYTNIIKDKSHRHAYSLNIWSHFNIFLEGRRSRWTSSDGTESDYRPGTIYDPTDFIGRKKEQCHRCSDRSWAVGQKWHGALIDVGRRRNIQKPEKERNAWNKFISEFPTRRSLHYPVAYSISGLITTGIGNESTWTGNDENRAFWYGSSLCLISGREKKNKEQDRLRATL